MATDEENTLNLKMKDGWEKLYRKFIGILPEKINRVMVASTVLMCLIILSLGKFLT
jgi:hypothetical protein